MEDVNHDLEIIQNDPLARRKAIDCGGAASVVVTQTGFDLIRDCFQLRLRAGRANDEIIGEAGNSREIKNDDIFGFFVRSQLGAGRG